MNYNFWKDKLDLKCIGLDAEMENRAKRTKEIEMEDNKCLNQKKK